MSLQCAHVSPPLPTEAGCESRERIVLLLVFIWQQRQLLSLCRIVLLLVFIWQQTSGSQLMSCSDELAVHSCPLLCLQRPVAKVASGLFYCWSLSRNNTMATDLQKFMLYYSSRRFDAWDCWTHTSWQVMRRDGDMLIAVSHVRLYFVKRSTSESITMRQQVWKIHY